MTDPVGFDWFDPNKTMELMAERQKIYAQETGAGGGVRQIVPEPVVQDSPMPRLSPYTQQWYDRLPVNVRPGMLRAKFPRVLETLRENWSAPAQLQAEFKRLLIDDRGSRQGFPFAALQELHRLNDYYFDELNPESARALGPRSVLDDQSR